MSLCPSWSFVFFVLQKIVANKPASSTFFYYLNNFSVEKFTPIALKYSNIIACCSINYLGSFILMTK